jgi:O-antigen/teichoic acid export membrane protein
LKFLRSILKPENKRTGTKVVRNVVFSGIRLFLLAPLPLIVVPFFLRKLGTAGYGTWAILLAISNMTSLADLGLVTTLSKHAAESYALKDFRTLNRLFNTGFALYLAIACLLAGILWAGSALLLSTMFRGSSVPSGELQVLWRYLMVLVIANILTLLFTSFIVGLQRMDLSASLAILNMLASAGLSLLLVSLNWGLRGAVIGYVAAAWLTLCCYVFVLQKLLPEITLNPLDCDWKTAKQVLSFSATMYVTTVAVVIHNQIEKLFLARFVGVVSAGWYDISSDLAVKLRAVPGFVLAPIMPAAAELSAQRDENKLNDLYRLSHKYLALIGVPFVVYVVFVAKRFVELWVGPELSVIAMPLSVLLIVNYVNLTTGPGFLIFIGKGKLRPGLYSALLGIALNLSLSYFLIRAYGFHGAVIGTSISLSVASAFFLYLYQRETGSSFLDVLRRIYLKPVACSVALLAVLWLLTRSQPSSWSGLVTHGIAFGIAYLVLLLLLQFFDSFDAAILKRLSPAFLLARKVAPGA